MMFVEGMTEIVAGVEVFCISVVFGELGAKVVPVIE